MPGLMLADDILVLAETAEELQASLRRVGDWASRWRMKVGHKKCGVIKFCGGSKWQPTQN